MMNNNKILTVSYGTFSCTLEGFEDSFDTMKAIAEYFRDLASDDRYFGAEPPQPDADMLARIAEREVARRVEAREHEGHFMLKAHDEAPASTAAPVTPVAAAVAAAPLADAPQHPAPHTPEPAQEFVAEPEPEVEAPEDIAEADVAEETPAPVAVEEAAETIADDIRPDASVEPAAVIEASDEDTQSDDATDTAAEDLSEVITEAETFENIEEHNAAPQIEEVAETTEAVAADDTPSALDGEETAEADDTEDTDALAAAFFAESVVVDGADPETEEEISIEVLTDLTSRDAPLDSPDEELVAEDVDTPAADIAEESFAQKLERIRAVVSQQDDTAIDADYEEEQVEAEPASSFDPLPSSFEAFNEDAAAETLTEAADDINEALEQDSATYATDEAFEDEADDLDSILSQIEAKAEAQDAEESFDLVSGADDENEPAENLFGQTEEVGDAELHARVLKVNRDSFEAALESGELEEYEDDSLLGAPSLDTQEEAELQKDLAELEADEPKAPAGAATAREALPALGEDASEDVSRLMAEADEQMNEPEAQTRRSAFAHLRAAVAARFADRSMDDGQKQVEEEAQVYRSDLAEVVKPRRPHSQEGKRTERPAEGSAAPLKLVAEQRIDAEVTEEERNPIAPRRVAASTQEDVNPGEDSGFAAYASEQGATSLTELLEAAAAYLAYVEGHDQFSRPQLMNRVRQADCGDFSREDGLRSFGQLLRNGKIEKIKGGRFAASEGIGYKPDNRAAG